MKKKQDMRTMTTRNLGRTILLVSMLSGGLLPEAALSQAPETPPAPRIYRDKVDAKWTGGKFWYRLDLPEKKREFIFVDAEKGERGPAFDHARVAAALTALNGEPADAKALPIVSLGYPEGGKKVVLRGGKGDYELDLESYQLARIEKTEDGENRLRPRRRPHPSSAGGEESSIRFINRLAEEVDLFWLEPGGGRKAQGSIPAGGESELPTRAGHAWLVSAKNGRVIAVYDAEEEPGIAVLGDTSGSNGQGPRDRPSSRPEEARSPDSKWEVFVRGDNLFLRDTKEGGEQQVTYDGHPADSYARNVEALRAIEMEYDTAEPEKPVPEVYWSPDSRHLVAMKHTLGSLRRIPLVESSPADQLQPKLRMIPYLKPGDDVPFGKPHLFSVDSKREIPVDQSLFSNPWSISDTRWNPDSGEFTFLFNQRGHQVLRILGVNAGTGAVRTVVEETSKTFICYSGKFFAEYLDNSSEIIWMSERDGWNHLYLYDAKTGKVKNPVTRGEWVVRGVDRVDREKRQVWFHASGMNRGEDPYYQQYYRVNFDGSGLTALTAGDGTHSVEYSPDGRYLIDTWSRVDLPPVNELRRVDDGKLVCKLEESDISELTAAGWIPPERFVSKGRDGTTDIHGMIVRPKGFDPARSYPVLEDVYAGPQDSFVPKAFSANYRQRKLTDLGFVIVHIDGMGTSNRSKAFHDVCWKNLGDGGLPDRVLWIKAAAKDRPWMDIARLGVFGTSAGGQTALRAVLDHGDFYKAAMADSGCHDNRMDKIWWNEQWMGWPLDESYVRSSNVVDAGKLQGKLLLMVGEVDDNVDPASTMQVVNALIKAGKDFELLAMPNMGHGVVRTSVGSKRLTDFFTRAFLTPPSQ